MCDAFGKDTPLRRLQGPAAILNKWSSTVSRRETRALRNLRAGSNVDYRRRRRWCHVPMEHSHCGNFDRLRCNDNKRGGATT
jgi:hypothetical protein